MQPGVKYSGGTPGACGGFCGLIVGGCQEVCELVAEGF